jgi:hypothetical protein
MAAQLSDRRPCDDFGSGPTGAELQLTAEIRQAVAHVA